MHEANDQLVFFLSPGALDQLRAEYLLPPLQALDVGAVLLVEQWGFVVVKKHFLTFALKSVPVSRKSLLDLV